MYIHERKEWPTFRWDASVLTAILENVSRKQGLLYGRLASLGFDSKLKAMAENLTYDVVYSSEIEGVRLNVDEVRSSVARKLGIENVKQTAPSHYVDSVVTVMLDATSHFDQALTKEKTVRMAGGVLPDRLQRGLAHRSGQIPYPRGAYRIGYVWQRESALHRSCPRAVGGGNGKIP